MTTPFATMDLVTIRRDVPSSSSNIQKISRMSIVGENVDAPPILVPYAPRDVDHSDLGGVYNVVSRPGKEDIVVYDRPHVPKMSFTLFLADNAVSTTSFRRSGIVTRMSVIAIIKALQTYSAQGTRVRITYGALESGLWFIQNVQAKSLERHPVTDEIVRGEVDLDLMRASEVLQSIGPLTGGVNPPATIAPVTPPQQTSARYYPVKAGDTLWGISIKFYGTGTRWTEIADANGVKDPRKLRTSTVLRIP